MPKLIALFLALCLALCGCSVSGRPQTVAHITPAPEAVPEAPALAQGPMAIYYPEGADEASAAYCLRYSLPTFSAQGPAGEAMDAALAAWLEELTDRVEAERLPLADRAEGEALPATEVTYELREAQTPLGNYANVLLYEKSWFEDSGSPETRLSTLVFDGDGAECSLASASGVYAPEPVAAQQVWNIIMRDPASYHGDLDVEDVSAALDLYNGFSVADEGYTLYVQPGILSPAGDGGAPLEFSFGRNAMYPDFVGESMSPEDYEALLPQFFAVATLCGPNFQSWKSGESLSMDEAYSHGLKLDEARVDGSSLVLTGLLIRGLPGDAGAVEAAKAELHLAPAPAGSDVAWTLEALHIT